MTHDSSLITVFWGKRIVPMRAAHRIHRTRRGIAKSLGSVVILGALALGVVVWVSSRRLATSVPSPTQAPRQLNEVPALDYTVTTEPGQARISGTTNLPNGVVLVGTLDKIGAGPLEVKEALVMNRAFAMKFGPQLQAQYHLLGQVDALTAGRYRMRVEFDPSRQSPFARELLVPRNNLDTAPMRGDETRDVDRAIIRVARTFSIGTPEEQERAQAIEQQYRQEIRQHLSAALGTLTALWQRLRAKYQQERAQGFFARTDPRAAAWRTWTAQWQQELGAAGETYKLDETVSPASPLQHLRSTLVAVSKHLQTLMDLYVEVLVSERPLNDRDLQWSERAVQVAFGDAIAQLGVSDAPPPVLTVGGAKPAVVVTAAMVNIRSGPGMNHDVVGRAKKDEALEFLGEQGEWFQVQLNDGRSGWMHRNIGSKKAAADALAVEIKRPDGKPTSSERRVGLQLDPIMLPSTPIEFIPRPTPDEFKVYGDLEQRLREVPYRDPDGRRAGEQRALQRVSEKYGISPEQTWNAYLKVQGWEVKQ